jgi:hypothetical protein
MRTGVLPPTGALAMPPDDPAGLYEALVTSGRNATLPPDSHTRSTESALRMPASRRRIAGR